MIPDIDIHRAAWLMIRRHGEGAATQTAMRGNHLLARDDLDGMLAKLDLYPEDTLPDDMTASVYDDLRALAGVTGGAS